MNKRIAVIGCGNMGTAIIKGLNKEKIITSDIRKTRLRKLKTKTALSNIDAVKKADIVILAVKPKDIAYVLNEIRGTIREGQLVISVAAGITTKKIENILHKKIPVIRVMPNTPALIGMGMSVLSAGKYAGQRHMQAAKKIFSRMGKVASIRDEFMMDAVTAISGSGPAYVYLFIDSLIKSARKLGLAPALAEVLVLQTLKGAVEMLEKTKKSPDALIKQVASPGGTTERALRVFGRKGFSQIVFRAVESACQRSKELACVG